MIELNQTYKVIEPFRTLCCSCVFEVGEILRPYKQPSKNRLWITRTDMSGHNVRRSNFERCTIRQIRELEDNDTRSKVSEKIG